MKNTSFFYARVLCDTNLYKVYISDDQIFHYGREIIVNTEFGEDLAVITSWKSTSTSDKLPAHIDAKFVRYATQEDRDRKHEVDLNTQIVKAQINNYKDNLKLNMQITHILVPLSGNSIGVFYVAQGRVDFRQLLIDLRQTFKEKIIMRQITQRQRRDSFAFDPRVPLNMHKNY